MEGVVSPGGRVDRFSLAVGLALLALMAGFRILSGAGLGLHPGEEGAVPSGFLFNALDNLSYASWAQQSAQGRLLFENLYTTEAHGRILFNVFFLLAGGIARFTGWAVSGTITLLGALGAFATLVVGLHAARALGFSRTASRWGILWLAFASGLSAPLGALSPLLGTDPFVGADLAYQDAVAFSTFLVYPYHSFALGLLSLVLWLAARLLARPPGRRLPAAASLAVAAALLGLTHPYEVMALLGASALFWASARRAGDGGGEARLGLLAAIAVAALPVAIYVTWVSAQPVWARYAAAATTLPVGRLSWVVGYGALLPLSLLGAWLSFRDPAMVRARLLACWVVPVLFLLIVVGVDRTRISNGAQLPICLLAGLGWAALLERIRRISSGARRAAAHFGVGVALPFFFATSLFLLVAVHHPHRYDAQLLRAARVARAQAPGGVPTLLADVEAGALLPGLSGVRVYAGHWALTPDFEAKRARLAEAGIIRAAAPGGGGSAATLRALRELIASSRADFLLLRAGSPADAIAEGRLALERVATEGPWRLYRVSRHLLAGGGRCRVGEPGAGPPARGRGRAQLERRALGDALRARPHPVAGADRGDRPCRGIPGADPPAGAA
jgi:hypothetical protein